MINALMAVLAVVQLSNPNVSTMIGNTLVSFFEKTEEFNETYDVSPGIKLFLTSRNGDVTLKKWDKDYVEVHATKKTNHDRDELAKVRIEVIIDDKMEIRSEYLDEKARVSVDYRINVPDYVIVEKITTANGDIELKSTQGDTRLVTANGDVEVKDVKGTVHVQTANGDIDVRTTTAIIKATTANGDIRADIRALPDQGTTTKTSNGSVDLLLSKELNADLHCVTSMGELEVKGIGMHVQSMNKTITSAQITGRIGDGGPELDVHTSNGDISIHELGR